MDRYELRIDGPGVPAEAAYEGVRSFSLGHESCVLRFFEVMGDPRLLEFAGRQKGLGKEIRLVTPFVPERHLDGMKRALGTILAHPAFEDCVVVVNDLGLMHYLHKTGGERRLRLGRGLASCFDYAPWGGSILGGESPAVRKAAAQISFYDDEKMDFFRRFRVTEVEADLTEGSAESLRGLQKEGFRVYVHGSSFLYGIQRSCYFRRTPAGEACGRCGESVKIEPERLWDSAGFFEVPPDVEFPDMYLRGNQICGRARDVPRGWADGVIVRAE